MYDPFAITGPACISFSGGRSSAYMLWRVLQTNDGRLPIGAVVAFANTGKEDPRTLDFVHECAVRWGISIWWLEYADNAIGFKLTDYNGASRNGEPYEALIRKKHYLPNAVTRFCTSELKIKPINSWLRHIGWDEFDMLVGIRADEPRRIAKMPHLHKPLALDGKGKQDVLSFWRQQPFDLLAEDGNCDLCFLKGLPELMSTIRKRPEKAVWWAAQEDHIGARFSKNRPTYAQMRQNALDQADMLGYEEESITCFCGD